MEDLSLHLMDIVQNSVKAEAKTIEIKVITDISKNFLKMHIIDDGWGMDKETLEKVKNPFYTTRTTRKAGLGISLFQSAAELTGGYLSISSEKGKGTELVAAFGIDSFDRQPIGSIEQTVSTLVASYPHLEFILYLERLNINGEKKEFYFDTKEVKEKIGDIPINNLEIVTFIEEMIRENIVDIFGGVLNEIIS